MQVISQDVARLLSLTVEDFDPGEETHAPFKVRVRVENASDLELDSCHTGAPMNLSYHWRNAETGEMHEFDGLRTELKPALPAGSTRTYLMDAMTPDMPGSYLLEVSLVQEYVMWLDGLARISPPPRVVRVTHQLWWTTPDSNVIFSPHEILNRQSLRKYLSYPGGFRPITIHCETVNLCNNSCIICAYDQQTRPMGTMSMEMFDRVLGDYSEMGGGHLSFTPMVGEVFLDKHLTERVRRCEEFPLIRSLSVTTNASVVDMVDDTELEYILSQLRRINISVYGLDASEYRKMTRRDTYDRLLRGIDRILRFARNELSFSFRLLTRRDMSEVHGWLQKIDSYSATRATVTVRAPIYEYANWGIFDIESPLPDDARWSRGNTAKKEQCMIPLNGCQIYWDGQVSFCSCDDYDQAESLHLGNLRDASLGELCSGEKARRLWNWSAHGVPEFCRSCTFHIPLSHLRHHYGMFEDPILLGI